MFPLKHSLLFSLTRTVTHTKSIFFKSISQNVRDKRYGEIFFYLAEQRIACRAHLNLCDVLNRWYHSEAPVSYAKNYMKTYQKTDFTHRNTNSKKCSDKWFRTKVTSIGNFAQPKLNWVLTHRPPVEPNFNDTSPSYIVHVSVSLIENPIFDHINATTKIIYLIKLQNFQFF